MPQDRPLYVIKDWDLLYETYESKRLAKACAWVAMPNKHDGKGFRRIVREKDGAALYGAWALVVQVASKCPVRGVLADLDGPLDALDLQDKTGIDAKVFDRTLKLVSSTTIGWARLVSEHAEITAALAEVTARRTQAGRKSPHGTRELPHANGESAGAPANTSESAGVPARLHPTPAPCGKIATSAETPARHAVDSAPRGRALADRTVPDSTGPDTPPGGCADALTETASKILGLFGKKRHRLGNEAEANLSRHAADLPLKAGQWAMLSWFYGLAPDESDIDLRSRYRDADALAKNLFVAVERAESYASRTGASQKNGAEKNHAAPADPAGCWEWFAAEYPDMARPGSWQALPESIRSEFSLQRRTS